jgi:hypothetical protein
MRVLVCGGRKFADQGLLNRTLDAAHAVRGFTVLIHGTQRGADLMAADWGERKGLRLEGFRPDWKRYGKAAGPIRNERMLKEGVPQLVIAFKGGDGTKDMIEKARAAGLTVVVIE